MLKRLTEGEAEIDVPVEDKISSKLPAFYNPVMALNRSISILLLNSIPDKNLRIALPLAASGIRGIRFTKELKKGKINEIFLNDNSPDAIKILKKNLRLNSLRNINVEQGDGNAFLLSSKGFDYIDIDPFGTPNPFLEAAVLRIARNGILAVTATDTGCLCGTYPSACKRKYFARPLRNEFMHETGLRILIAKVQLIGAQYDKALVPIFSYSKDHYFRVFFRCTKGRQKADAVMGKMGYILHCHRCLSRITSNPAFIESSMCDCGNLYDHAGPLWLGRLWDTALIKRMCKNSKDPLSVRLLDTIREESEIVTAGYYNIHTIVKKHKVKMPKTDELIMRVKKKGFSCSRTHFDDVGIRSDADINDLVRIFGKKIPKD